ncbi:MAG: hypothetical protein ACPLRW_07860 [Moorellales bacterium]
MADYWTQWGGKSAYITSQQKRYEEAKRTGNVELLRRLEADAARVGYNLPTGGGTGAKTVADYAKAIQQAQAAYAAATTPQAKQAAHQQAEAARQAAARAGISTSALNQAVQQAWQTAATPQAKQPATAGAISTGAQPALGTLPGDVVIPRGSLTREQIISLIQGETPATTISQIGGTGSTWGLSPTGALVLTSRPVSQYEISPETGLPVLRPEYQWLEAVQQQYPELIRQYYEEQMAQQQAQYNAMLSDILGQIQQLTSANATSAETAPLVKQFYDQTLAAIAEAEQRIVSTLQQQMGGVDPATQAALASLRETVQRQRENLMEEMSRRGLLQSGIWLEMESRLAQGEMTEAQKLLAQQLSNLQNQLVNALATFGQLRVQAAQQFGIEGLRQIESEAQRRQEALTEALRQAVDIYKFEREQPRKEWETYGPYFVPKASERLGYQQWLTETFEKAPPTSGQAATGGTAIQPDTTLVQSRAYAAARGATVDWDPKTREVIVNGVRIKPDQVTEDGRAWVQKWKMDMALGYL